MDAEHVGANGRNGVVLVVFGRRGACEVEDPIRVRQEEPLDVVLDTRERRMCHQRSDVSTRAGEEVVEAQHVVPLAQEALTKVRPPRSLLRP